MNDYKKICLLALNNHRQLKRQYQKKMRSLSAYDGILLQSSLRKGTPYYYCLKKGGKRRYLGRETHEVVRKIRELRFCKKMVEILDDNIRLLREFTERYCDTDVESVRQRLPKQYIPLLTDILELNTDSIEARVQAMRERKATIPPRHPEALRITTFDGTLVRSRVEALLYERFCAAGFYVFPADSPSHRPGHSLGALGALVSRGEFPAVPRQLQLENRHLPGAGFYSRHQPPDVLRDRQRAGPGMDLRPN